ncbi:alkyl/aryl-sulfatase [Pseudomonas nitroreducens]|uniref:alkyl/aryl-sulfatase n=1 Tax=Pseudomonas nitroreducens TaxID=46680 RepID=UPI00209C8E78|nr:alkyl sulfatase dimerization domain-containing protein [Pseudomonas nitroreducens]MCP1626330.1 alkyl sulfatase BDS1-like metallo-beta-lactamase superfamily hydrolase [Pseudomonas nitroreducens]
MKSRIIRYLPHSLLAGAIAASLHLPLLAAETTASQPASSLTAAKNAEVLKVLPFSDRSDYESVTRGLVAPFRGQIRNAAGRVVWDSQAHDFLDADKAPDTVNPSLWRAAQLNNHAGLFQVADGIYQLRGMDVSNMTIIEGKDGLFVIDPLTYAETARAALELYYQHRPKKPIVGVGYSHSHGDHFGGVRGVVDEADVKSGKVKIFAPAGFMEHAISENIFAGNAMSRRSQFQFGTFLPRGERGQLDVGMGKALPSGGTFTLIAPTDLIRNEYETHTVAGIQIEFQLTPGTEAPAEMNFYFPQHRALCMSENSTQMMHNILTPRGALVRDAKAWSQYLDASLERYGEKTDVMFVSHNWPTWGGERIRTLLADQRDMYAFLNDRTLHLMNQGLTSTEIAERMDKLPGELEKKWYTRGYYGSLSHNSRAVYQRYLGFYDGNPANLNPLTPVDAGNHYVEALGGADAVLKLVRAAIDKGDYRWAATLGNHLIFAQPDNQQAKALQADALEQLGYQAENALWRNIYLTGAMELRGGVPVYDAGATKADVVKSMEPGQFFDFLAIRLDSDKAQGHDMVMNWVFSDLGKDYAVTLRNGVLTHRNDEKSANPTVTVTLAKSTLDQISLRKLDFPTAIKQGDIKLDGNAKALGAFLGMIDSPAPQFNIVTP